MFLQKPGPRLTHSQTTYRYDTSPKNWLIHAISSYYFVFHLRGTRYNVVTPYSFFLQFVTACYFLWLTHFFFDLFGFCLVFASFLLRF